MNNKIDRKNKRRYKWHYKYKICKTKFLLIKKCEFDVNFSKFWSQAIHWLWEQCSPNPKYIKKKKNTSICIYVLILAILFYKIKFCIIKNIIESFKNNTTIANLSITLLQIVQVYILIVSHVDQPLTLHFSLSVTSHHISTL